MITSDGRSDAEIKIQTGTAKDTFQMEKILKNQRITIYKQEGESHIWQRVLNSKHAKMVRSDRQCS